MAFLGTLDQDITSEPDQEPDFIYDDNAPAHPDGSLVLIDNEVLRVGTFGAGGLSGLVRGLFGSKAASHSEGTPANLVVSATPNATGCFVVYIDCTNTAVAKVLPNADVPFAPPVGGSAQVLAEFSGFGRGDTTDIVGNEGAGFDLSTLDAENTDLFVEVGFITEEEND